MGTLKRLLNKIMGTLKRLLNKIIRKTDETEEKANVIKKKETKKVVLRKKTASQSLVPKGNELEP